MMPNNLPFFSHFFPNYYARYPYRPNNYHRKNMNNTNTFSNSKSYSNNSNTYHKTNEVKPSHEPSSQNDDTLFEIFGIKLHQDDLLLIGLIFFLYTEGVKDEFLFIALILLLLS